jgi:hypothetical protein
MSSRKIRVITSTVGLVAAVLTTGALLAQPTEAVSASCVSKLETIEHTLYYDDHRAGAYCTSIGSDTMVRAKLVKNGGPDAASVWFTATRVWKYTGWKTCAYGCWDTYELKDR